MFSIVFPLAQQGTLSHFQIRSGQRGSFFLQGDEDNRLTFLPNYLS